MIGQLLRGHYQIIRTLSSGGFGQTYLAQDSDIPGNPICVVKQLKPLSTDPAHLEIARQLFEREAEKLTLLGKHDQIPRLLAYFKENDEFYLVQEYIEGHTLNTELPPGHRWSEAQVLDLLQQMLTVLVFVHDEGMIHRDIKPANIIRRQHDNKLVLIDFGAVKEVQAQSVGAPGQPVTVATGTQIGTAGYMPTEQGRGKPKPSSDLYALGMIGIQALTGRFPHQLEEDSRTGEVIWQNLAQVSPGLANVLTQMTRYHFKDRYQSAVEALQAVRKLTTSSGVTSSGAAPTVAATQMRMESVHELTLEWMDAGQTWSQIIRPQQPTKFPGRVRIGRDSAQCDIVLSNSTVSALHVEVFFDPQQQRFMMRNLRENNLPYVDGQPLLQGERVLNQGNVLRLGEVELRVGSIALKQYPVGSVPSGSFSTPQPSSPQPVAATVQTGRSSSSPKMAANEYVTNISSKSSSSGSTPVNPPKPPKKISRLWSGLIVALIVGGSAAYRSYNSFQLRQIAKGKEAEAKLYVPVMTRAQQAFFFEKGYFASLTELNSDGLNIREQTVNYRYRVASVSTTKTMVSGIALKEGLRSFVGIVWREPPNTEGESDTRGVICESVTTEEPSLPETNDCPSGFSRIEAVRGVDESGVFNK